MNDNMRRRVYKDESPIEYLRLKEKLKINRFIKTRERSKKEREILLRLSLKRIEEAEKKDFIKVGKKRVLVKI